jgi:hypothetical protein
MLTLNLPQDSSGLVILRCFILKVEYVVAAEIAMKDIFGV